MRVTYMAVFESGLFSVLLFSLLQNQCVPLKSEVFPFFVVVILKQKCSDMQNTCK